MSGRPTAEVRDAVAHLLSTGCTPLQAAARFGVHVRSIQRALAKLGKPNPVGHHVGSRGNLVRDIAPE